MAHRTMTTLMISVTTAIAGFAIGHRFFQPLGWRLFRITHRNNPDALAFADREDPPVTELNPWTEYRQMGKSIFVCECGWTFPNDGSFDNRADCRAAHMQHQADHDR